MKILSRKPYGPNIFDLVISFLVITVSLGSVWGMYDRDSEGKTHAMIYQNGKLIREYDLHNQPKTQLEFDNTIIDVENGRVRIEKSDCPRGICQHSGWIFRPPETIVCVPKKMLIEIVGMENQTDYNAVSF